MKSKKLIQTNFKHSDAICLRLLKEIFIHVQVNDVYQRKLFVGLEGACTSIILSPYWLMEELAFLAKEQTLHKAFSHTKTASIKEAWVRSCRL